MLTIKLKTRDETMRILLAGFVVLLGMSHSAHALNFARTVSSGSKTTMHIYRSWKLADCSSEKGIVRPLIKPSHGKLTAGEGAGVVTGSRFVKNDPCVGKMMTGLQVDYESDLGFRGIDSFQIEVTFGNHSTQIDTYAVTVE
jgi:hypothetical protein